MPTTRVDLPAAFRLVDAVRVAALPGYQLDIAFSDGSFGVFDFTETVMSGGPMVHPLRDENFFSRIFLETGVPTWPNGYDADPSNIRIQLAETGLLRSGGEPLLIKLPAGGRGA
jgi:hypothetical protein